MLESISQATAWSVLRTLADILIVAFIAYRVFLLLTRTRALQLLVGVAIILLVDLFARLIDLSTVSWIITNVSQYLVFGLIVLLQPELRRLISEIGRMPIFQWINPRATVEVAPIVEAVRNMAQQRVGSIIVLLREIRPQTIIDSAVRVDGAITAELLQTIFHKDTPLHDGAVFIEGNRIVAASCYLPMSGAKLKKTHGARHRAGMGMSEESDGIVIVTSEESGRISVMLNGEIRSGVRPGELGPLLQRLLSSSSEPLAPEEEALDEARKQEAQSASAAGRDGGAAAEGRKK
ncbi:MAG: diadenylate cyclase CdaA [Leptospirales bacterium]|nr:diadenylate cyclase CdaA [Leptospirales bacterium]